ncbi:MAG: response regulator [Anaeromyxobacter sp.]|nr:response regulator [Anaeromyxobacter sp.]MBL0277319.1 response regulator [Anaeromyxobacter sp.]
MKILIADDDRLVRAMLTDLLCEIGHAVVQAENGAEAVLLCAREAPDLLILDFLMPKLSGLDALLQIRRTRPVPAVLLTAINEGSLRGVDGVEQVQVLLQKPFSRRTLERAISTAVGAR